MIDDFKQPSKPRLNFDSPQLEQGRVGRPTPEFKTPEEAASLDAYHGSGPELPAPITGDAAYQAEHTLPERADSGKAGKPPKPPKQPGKKVMLFGKWPVSRKKLIIWIVVIVLLLGAGGAAAYYKLVYSKPAPVSKPTSQAKKVAPPAPAPILSPLTGLPVDSQEKTTWPVIGAMIENSPDARPQSGLKDAGVVFEAIAEGGITRFLALFQESQPGNIGPIRSSRPYYLDWAMAFDASYAHVGGSPDALARIKSIGVRDLDQFYNPAAYHRITTRFAPHNVYTGVQQLANLSISKGWDKSKFTPFSRKADKPFVAASASNPAPTSTTKPNTSTTKPQTDSRTPANSINFSISSDFYSAHYDYDPTNNVYKRSEGGSIHMDADSNTQIMPKVVIALVMPYSLMADGYHSQYNTIGSGKMYVFQDGTVTTGTWSKGEPKTQFEFKDDAGKTIALNAGQTWISVVADAGKVSYK
jgi:hypothetical protein